MTEGETSRPQRSRCLRYFSQLRRGRTDAECPGSAETSVAGVAEDNVGAVDTAMATDPVPPETPPEHDAAAGEQVRQTLPTDAYRQ